jgi:hypothetical protein
LTTQYNEVSFKHSPSQVKWALWTSRSTSTWPLGVLITYGVPRTTSDNLDFLAQVELIKSCDGLESNNMIIGRSLRKNVAASTFSLVGISSMVV